MYMGIRAFFLKTTVYNTVSIPSKCTFGKSSIKSFDTNISVPSIANITVSLTRRDASVLIA